MPNRNGGVNEYRYQSLNGMERDDEVKGNNNHLDFGARAYDSRLGRFMSMDAYSGIYPSLSDYSFVADNPIRYVDLDGNKIVDPNGNRVELKFDKNGDLSFGGKGILSEETKTTLKLISTTKLGRNLLENADKHDMNLILDVRDALVLYSAPLAYDEQYEYYKKQFKEGIKIGQFTIDDYKGENNYYMVGGINTPLKKFVSKDGVSFMAKVINTNITSLEAGQGLPISKDNPLNTKDEPITISGDAKILEKPLWNYDYKGDIEAEIAGTFLHELIEGMFDVSETKSRKVERNFHRELRGRKATKNKQPLKIESPRF